LQSYPSLCSGVLEDPSGLGRQFVFSAAGSSTWLKDSTEATSFFASWRQDIEQLAHTIDFPTLHHVFYTAYEAGILFETLPQPKNEPDGGLIWLHKPDWCVCFSAAQGKVYLSSVQSEQTLDWLEQAIVTPVGKCVTEFSTVHDVQYPHSDYQQAVSKVCDYISQGDVFQANIARFWHKKCDKEQLHALYAKLRTVNPAPFSCFIQAGGLTILSASPERLFSIDVHGNVAARPIAGTRRRCEGEQDDLLADELLLSEKERAEHIMLLDLERNDLGRVCVPGSIHVDECMVIEKYTTVQHIVSNVTGTLAHQYDMLDVLKAMFPGGTITGCPKVRCMEIIHELEPVARGPYTGGVGYMAWDGSVDMNILIRTFWHWQDQLCWAAGAGIVADSIAEMEELETEHKVAGLMRVFS